MATSSLFHSITIKDDESLKTFLEAIERSRLMQKDIKEPEVTAKEMTKEDMKEIFGRLAE